MLHQKETEIERERDADSAQRSLFEAEIEEKIGFTSSSSPSSSLLFPSCSFFQTCVLFFVRRIDREREHRFDLLDQSSVRTPPFLFLFHVFMFDRRLLLEQLKSSSLKTSRVGCKNQTISSILFRLKVLFNGRLAFDLCLFA